MGINSTNYVLDRKYVEDSAIALGAVKGAPCQVDSIVKNNGVTTVTLKWVGDDKTTVNYSSFEIDDGTPIYVWTSGNTYKYGDLAIYNSCFYRCITENSDVIFDDTKWNEIGSPDGSYDIVQNYSLLPPRFTAADRKMYYAISDYTDVSGITYLAGYYLWDGTKWTRIQPDVLDRFSEIIIYEDDGVTVKRRDLYFDGHKVINEDKQDYQVVDNYSDIDSTQDKNVVYMVQNPTYDTTDPTKIIHYSGEYLFNSTSKTIEYIQEKESENIDFDSEYISPIEG